MIVVFAGSSFAEAGAADGVGCVDGCVNREAGCSDVALRVEFVRGSVGVLLRLAGIRTLAADTGLVRICSGMDCVPELVEGRAVDHHTITGDIAPQRPLARQLLDDLSPIRLDDLDKVARDSPG